MHILIVHCIRKLVLLPIAFCTNLFVIISKTFYLATFVFRKKNFYSFLILASESHICIAIHI